MAFDSSTTETRLLWLERKFNHLFQVADEIVLFRLPAIEQSLAMRWSVGPRRKAQLVGEVDGCTSHAFPGAAVVVKDHASGVQLGSAICDANGKYEVWANLGTDPQSLDVVATPTGTHASTFAASATLNLPTAHAGGNGVPTFAIPPAAGFCCGATNYFPAACVWTFNIKGCLGTGIAGATISISSGSCVTGDGTGGTTLGQCTINPPAGTYLVTVTPPAGSGFATSTTTVAFSASTTTNITLAPDASHVCTTLCNYPMPKTLFTTDGLGTHTLTWNGSAWAGTATTPGVSNNCVFGSPMTVAYSFSGSVLSIKWKYICCGDFTLGQAHSIYVADDYTIGGEQTAAAASPAALACPPSFSVTCNVPVRDTALICFNDPATGGPGNQTPGGGGPMLVTP